MTWIFFETVWDGRGINETRLAMVLILFPQHLYMFEIFRNKRKKKERKT